VSGLKKGRTTTEAIVGVSTYFHSARDRIPDTLVLKHEVFTAIEMTIAEVQGILEIDPFELSPFLYDREIIRGQGLPVFLHILRLVHSLFHHVEIGARGQGYNGLESLKQPWSQPPSE